MAWRSIDVSEVRLTPQELAALNAIAGSITVGAQKLANVVGEFRDTIVVVGTPLGADGTIPDRVREQVINRTRWLWLCEFPQLKNLQTEGRSKLNEAAEKMLADISTRTVKVPPGDGSSADQTLSPKISKRHLTMRERAQEGL